ncbi:MAG: hypothetical protein AB1715_04915 [Acidobacteriota bacterium]
MKKRLTAGTFLLVLLLFSGRSLIPETALETLSLTPAGPLTSPQEYLAQKPKPDYMSSFFSRNTRPLGLREDLALKELLKQPGVKWAVRTGMRHILD